MVSRLEGALERADRLLEHTRPATDDLEVGVRAAMAAGAAQGSAAARGLAREVDAGRLTWAGVWADPFAHAPGGPEVVRRAVRLLAGGAAREVARGS